MTKAELTQRLENYKTATHDALQLIWDNTNKGQRNKLLKNEDIKAMLDRYGVQYDG